MEHEELLSIKETVETVRKKYKIAAFKRSQMPFSIPSEYVYGHERD